MIKLIAGFLIAAGLGCAQVSVLFSPGSIASTADATGPAKEAGTWHVYLCSSAPAAVLVPRERLFMMAPEIRFLTDFERDRLITARTKRNWKAVTARALTYAAAGIGAKVYPPAAVALPLIDLIHDKVQAEAPTYAVSDPLEPVVSLQPGQCVTRSILAARMPAAKPIGPKPVAIQ